MCICVWLIFEVEETHAELVAVYCNTEVTAAAATNWERMGIKKNKNWTEDDEM